MKKISIKEYNKKMDKIMAKKLPVQEILIKLLEETSKYDIKESK